MAVARGSPGFADERVAAAFAAFPEPAREPLLHLRGMIFRIAAETPGVGAVQETLKWGQPAYLTPETKSGSTLRLGVPKTGGYAIYAHCQTTIVSDFARTFPQDFRYDGNRAVVFEDGTAPDERLDLLIRHALTYRRA